MNEFAMHDAAVEGDLERMRQLIEAGVPVDCLNGQGQSPLHLAAEYGHYEVATLLINSKCNINLKDLRGRTPIILAAVSARKNIVHLLLHHGAQVNCADYNGWTLLQAVSSNTGWTDIVRIILDIGKVDINADATQFGSTPLIWAVTGDLEEVTAFFIRAGADVNRGNADKVTALHFSVLLSRTRVFQILLEKKGLDLNPQNTVGDTPLHFACWMSRREAIKQLLDAGADTNIKNNRGETALSVGIRLENLNIEEIRMFVQKGAFLENCDYVRISQNPFHKENLLKDVEFGTQCVVNKVHRQSLPALDSITYFPRRLPNVDNFKLTARQIDEVKNLVKSKIVRNTWCNVVEVHPISLSALCVLSLITCQSDKKRAASPDFGHSPFKKNS